ncbi:MAG: inorganic diphosphatase [Planctomycetes bacterium]|nr:inorganic diphosphatase [Planctomycetota bacterium]
MKALWILPALTLPFLFGACGNCESCKVETQVVDPLFHPNAKSYLNDYEAQLKNGDVNVVIEIPAGTTAKWEVTKPEGELRWEIKNEKPRVVKFLGYPANYGMIPRTLLPKELGGDGDPLDVMILGDAMERGSVVPARLIGVMNMIDGGEQDDKLIAVRPDSPFGEVKDLADLEEYFPGTTTILRTWFTNYKGPGEITVPGFADRDAAQKILTAAIEAYQPPQ